MFGFGGQPAAPMATGSAMDYLAALDTVNCVQIKEKVNLVEAATAILGQEIEMANKYKIKDRETGQELFYIVENTDCCKRQMKQLCGDCAPWSADVMYTGNGQMVHIMKMERPSTCTCCCLNRPVMRITDAQTGNELGSVQDPCTFCNLAFTVRDEQENAIVTANGGCCQWGLCCPLPCGPCAKVEFQLQDADSGSDIGMLTKKVPGILKFFFAPDVDNYHVEFTDPSAWNGKKKALMMALAIFMDFRIFSDNKNDSDGGLMGAIGDE